MRLRLKELSEKQKGKNMIQKLKQTEKAAHLFQNWPETILWSCIQKVMGSIYTDNPEAPESAMAVLGDFCFLAGAPKEALLTCDPSMGRKQFQILVPQTEDWSAWIERVFGEKVKRIERYALKKEPDVFDREKLGRLAAALPEGYVLRSIDEELYTQCKSHPWSADLVAQFADYEAYEALGLGVAAIKDGKIAAGASSYSRYREGIEIEIDTEPSHRRKGLATACGAKLILRCLDRGLYPSWDAQNLWSVALAEKLGYHFSHTYTAYELNRQEENSL